MGMARSTEGGMSVANLPDCPWCGEKMRFDADSVHCWFKCDNCLAASPKALREWDVAKSTKDNWTDNEQHALRLTKEVEWHVHPPRWISAEERLPEQHSQKCLCWCVFGNDQPENGFAHVATWYSHGDNGYVNGPHFSDEGYCGMHVTHWMPLPEPPKESKREVFR